MVTTEMRRHTGHIAEVKLEKRSYRRGMSFLIQIMSADVGSHEERPNKELLPVDLGECLALLMWFYFAKIKWLF